ncbi:hypothetical protein Tco_1065656 [Tanacetum coccineum]
MKHLRSAVQENYLQQTKHIKGSVEIHHIKQVRRIYGRLHGKDYSISRGRRRSFGMHEDDFIFPTKGKLYALSHGTRKTPYGNRQRREQAEFQKASKTNTDRIFPNKILDEFHSDTGHSTDECMQLRKQIDEMIKAGKLSQFIKELKQNDKPKAAKKGEASGKDKPLAILMIQPWERVAKPRITQSFSSETVVTPPNWVAAE